MYSIFPIPVKHIHSRFMFFLIVLPLLVFVEACSTSAGNEQQAEALHRLPVVTLQPQRATTYDEYPAALEGSKDIEISPQVGGQLEHIYVVAGAYVVQRQPLVRVIARVYAGRLHHHKA